MTEASAVPEWAKEMTSLDGSTWISCATCGNNADDIPSLRHKDGCPHSSETDRVGPVIMGHPIAKGQLESEGVVYSFRTSDRTTGETHYRYERTGTKQGDVVIARMTGEIEPTEETLRQYRRHSGFETVEEWLAAIAEVHGDAESGYVYRIELRGETDD